MSSDIDRHLDGELSAEALEPEERNEVDEWGRMIASFRTAAPRGGAPPWLEQRVMAEIESLPERSVLRRLSTWFVRPAPVRISPLAAGLVAAAFALVVLLPGQSPGPERGAAIDGTDVGGPEPVVYVQFILDAPDATSVAVAGDFNEWQPSFTLEELTVRNVVVGS